MTSSNLQNEDNPQPSLGVGSTYGNPRAPQPKVSDAAGYPSHNIKSTLAGREDAREDHQSEWHPARYERPGGHYDIPIRPAMNASNGNETPERFESELQPAFRTVRIPPATEAENLAYAREMSLQDARERSLQEVQEHPVRQNSPAAKPQTSNVQEQLQKMMQNIPFLLSNELQPLLVPGADTVIYIGPPPREGHQTTQEYDNVRKHFETVHLCSSAALKNLDSAFFNKALGPMSLRAERRLRRDGVLKYTHLPANIKYYIDLRPPSEDDEAVILLSDLTCTQGILQWHLAKEKYKLPDHLVLGNDKFDSGSRRLSIPNPNEDAEGREGTKPNNASISGTNTRRQSGNLTLSTSQKGGDHKGKEPSTENMSTKPSIKQPVELEPEYSGVRHRSAIERLLYVIHRLDPKLDSAPKVWTFFAVAKYFDCATHERVSGEIYRWLYSGGNLNFIQCNPEVVYRIGMGIQSRQLVQAAYSFLVGEKALMQVYGEYDPKKIAPGASSVHGRRLELLDDDEKNRIDHGASSLIRRVRNELRDVTRNGMTWMHQSPEYMKVISLSADTEEQYQVIQRAISLIVDYVRGRIYWVLCKMHIGSGTDLDSNARVCSSFRTGVNEPFNVQYNRLNQPTRIFTRTFWFALRHVLFEQGHQNTYDPESGNSTWSALAQHMVQVYPDDPENGIKPLFYNDVVDAVSKVNSIVFAKNHPKAAALYDGPTPVSQGLVEDARKKETSSKSWPKRLPDKAFRTAEPQVEMQDADSDVAKSDNIASPEKRRRISSETAEGHPPSVLDRLADLARSRIDSKFHEGFNAEAVESAASGANDDDFPWQDVQDVNVDNDTPRTQARSNEPYQTPRFATPGSMMDIREDVEFLPPVRQNHPPPDQTLDTPSTAVPSYIHLSSMLTDFTAILSELCNDMLYPPHLFLGEERVPNDLVDTLMCMDESEWKYLPLWADGYDDGTGGVFDDVDVPMLEAGGFRGGRRGYGAGQGQNAHGADSVSGSDTSGFDDIGSEAISTVGRASRDATDGTETVKSMASDASSQDNFMPQHELYAEVMEMKMQQDLVTGGGKGKGRAIEHIQNADGMDDFMNDEDEDGGASTVMGAGSDVQGHMFGDMDSDGGHDMNAANSHEEDATAQHPADQTSLPLRGGAHDPAIMEGEDEDFEII